MMKMTTAFALFVFISGFSVPTFASPNNALSEAGEPTPPSAFPNETEETFANPPSGVLLSPDGEIIGAVVDFIFDLKANRILYAAGVLHTSEEFANRVLVFPWSSVQVNLDLNSFTLDEGKTPFEKAPSFSAEAWPSLPTEQWTATINAAGKDKRNDNAAMGHVSDPVLARASDLIGKTVTTTKGEDVGSLAELLVDPEDGAIAYAVISFDDSGDNSHLVFYSLPWTTVQADPVQLTFVVPDAVKKELHDSPLPPIEREPRLEASVVREKNHMTA